MSSRGVLDGDGFGAAVLPHLPALYRFAASLTSPDEADDLVQDALARGWAKRSAFDPDRGSLLSWLLAIVADQARSRWRRRDPLVVGLHIESSTPGPDGVASDLRTAVAMLPPRQRTAVVLRHYVDLDLADIARVMGCSLGTVKSTLHDARAALARELGASYARS